VSWEPGAVVQPPSAPDRYYYRASAPSSVGAERERVLDGIDGWLGSWWSMPLLDRALLLPEALELMRVRRRVRRGYPSLAAILRCRAAVQAMVRRRPSMPRPTFD
jgi:hypothetical protein